MSTPTQQEIDAAAERLEKYRSRRADGDFAASMDLYSTSSRHSPDLDARLLSQAYLADRAARAEREKPPVPYIELNMRNYDDADVCQLNEWAIWAASRIDELESEATE